MQKEWDVFISHASEDQESFVRPLAQALSQLGVAVWYSEFSLEVGDSVSRSIDKGLSSSKFGVVVVSQSFIAKKWPERELQGLVQRQTAEQVVILPIWLGVTHQQVMDYSPPLADAAAIVASGIAAEHVVIAILKKVRPDIYAQYPRPKLEAMVRGEALQQLQIELDTIKDELRELIATEFRNIMRFACDAVLNTPIRPSSRLGPTPEEVLESQDRQKIAREIAGLVLGAAEDYLREAEARVVEKTDPQRANIIRRLKQEF